MEEGAQYEYFCERGLKNGFHLPLAVYVEKYDDGTGTLARRKKKSFDWYKEVIASNGENL